MMRGPDAYHTGTSRAIYRSCHISLAAKRHTCLFRSSSDGPGALDAQGRKTETISSFIHVIRTEHSIPYRVAKDCRPRLRSGTHTTSLWAPHSHVTRTVDRIRVAHSCGRADGCGSRAGVARVQQRCSTVKNRRSSSTSARISACPAYSASRVDLSDTAPWGSPPEGSSAL